MAGAQGPAALALGTQQQLLAGGDRWRSGHHAFSFASPVPSSSLAALQRPAHDDTPHGPAASGGAGGCGAPPQQQAMHMHMQARSASTSPTAMALAATLESAAKQRVRGATGCLDSVLLCTAPCMRFQVVQMTPHTLACCRGWRSVRCIACRPLQARQRGSLAQLRARRMPARRRPASLALQTPPMATRECRRATSWCSPRGPPYSSSTSTSSSARRCSSGSLAAQRRRPGERRPPAPAAASVGQERLARGPP